eukprot:GHRR01013069.1.p1 GENE.GHRR01013069.1~~GHRR01013069.1.p1  ORF type:complete len:117 (+),score=15.12 GHRR01013069.1:363-713(+)
MAFQTGIQSTDVFKNEVLGTPGVLQVVECYSDWAGPCKPVVATLRSLYYSLSDKPVKFYAVNVDKVQGLEQYRGKCQPVFLLYRDSAVLQTVTGVQTPSLTQLITSLSDPASKLSV